VGQTTFETDLMVKATKELQTRRGTIYNDSPMQDKQVVEVRLPTEEVPARQFSG